MSQTADRDRLPNAVRPVRVRRATVPPSVLVTKVVPFTMFLAPLQIFLFPIGGIYPSLYLLLSCIIIAWVFIYGDWKLNFGIILIVILIAHGVMSILWSQDKVLGVREFLYGVPFLAFYIISSGSRRDISFYLKGSFKVFCIVSAFHSCVVAVFLFFPAVESAFWSGYLSKIFINPNAFAEFSQDIGNNVLDPWKAGGFFLNANVSAVMSETAAYASIYVAGHGRRKFWYFVAFCNFGGALASGSKAALAMVAIIPVATYFIVKLLARRYNASRILLLALLMLSSVGIAYSLAQWLLAGSDLLADAEVNAERRRIIWSFAWSEFLESPFLGLGYGGWPMKFAPIGSDYISMGLHEAMAPHNSLIYLWAQSGILAPVIAIVFVLYSFKRILRAENIRRDFSLAWASLGCLSSIFLHSLSENYTLINEPHFQAPFALLIGFASALRTGEQPTRRGGSRYRTRRGGRLSAMAESGI